MIESSTPQIGINPNIIFKRKFRWLVEFDFPTGKCGPFFVQIPSRPTMEIEETEINFLSSKTWSPTEHKWNAIELKFYDSIVIENELKPLYKAIGEMYDLTQSDQPPQHKEGTAGTVTLTQSDQPPQHKEGTAGTVTIQLLDGCGMVLETWTLTECWVKNISFGRYEGEDDLDIDMILCYKSCCYKRAMPPSPPLATCPHCEKNLPAGSRVGPAGTIGSLGMSGNIIC